jgi:hypothetical protein
MKNKDINISAVLLYDDYKHRCNKPVAKEDFHRKLAEIGIIKGMNGRKMWYNVTHDVLLNIGNTRKWINDVDEYDDDEFEDNEFDDSTIESDTQQLINHTKRNNVHNSLIVDV